MSATVDDSLIQNYVVVCFDTSIEKAPGAPNTAYHLAGVDNRDGDRRTPTSVTVDTTNTSCVRLLFAANVNLGSYTIVEVAADAVRPAGGAALGNIEAAAQLDNTDVEPVIGRIGGPNLIATHPVDCGGCAPGTGAVQYDFDKDISGAVAADFGYFADDGEWELGDAIQSTDGGSVIVVFTGLSGDDPTPTSASRFFALSGAVDLANRTSGVNDNRAESIDAPGRGDVARPTLTSVSIVAGQSASYDLHYDQLINQGNLNDCLATLSVGASYPATSGQVVGNGSILRVTFGGLTPGGGFGDTNADDEIVRITDQGVPTDPPGGGCVHDRNDSSRGSTVSSIAVRLGDNIPGFTSGPDLTGCTGSPSTNEVTYTFDELLTSFAFFTPDPGDFAIKSTTGGNQNGQSIRDVTDNTVTVIFNAGAINASTAAACHVDRGAVFDRDPRIGLDFNPVGTVRYASDGTPPVGQIPVGGGTVFVPVAGPPGANTNTVSTVPGPAGPATNTNTNTLGSIVRKTPQSLTLNAKCTAKGEGKYSCHVSGTLRQANSVRALGRAKACNGTVKVQYKSGTKTVSTRLLKVKQSTCTYSGTVNFNKPERLTSGLKVRGRYNGNKYSKTKYSRTVFVIKR